MLKLPKKGGEYSPKRVKRKNLVIMNNIPTCVYAPPAYFESKLSKKLIEKVTDTDDKKEDK